MTTVLHSTRFQDEIKTLKKDPIIQQMTFELKEATMDLDSWDLISRASNTYHERGGTEALTIGGPMAAIKDLLTEAVHE